MRRLVVISKTAERKLDALIDYLIMEWSPSTKDKFLKELNRCVSIIREMPESFPESKKNKGLRKCVVTEQTVLFYRFDPTAIYIVTIFDSRQRPGKLDKEI